MQTALILLLCVLAGAYLLRRALRVYRGQTGCCCGSGDCGGKTSPGSGSLPGESLVQLSEDPHGTEREGGRS